MLSNWAKYTGKGKTSPKLITVITIKFIPNRLTLLYSEIHYKKENCLRIGIVSLNA